MSIITLVTGRLVRAVWPMATEKKKVIFGSSLGTLFEWYDFYLYGSLAAIIAKQFSGGLDPTTGYIFALLAFAAGFLVRPFGAIVFGRLGDMLGRKRIFLVTILVMGWSTFLVGCLPSYASIGSAAPVLLIALRLLQGLAIGGGYGGAASYIAEHAPRGQRGTYTGWLQTTATLGLLLALMVILAVREVLGEAVFADWGWRVPFLLSIVPLGVSVRVQRDLHESPAFQKLEVERNISKAPLTESFGEWSNLKVVILALLGLTAGLAVVWYTGHYYALFFLTTIAKVDSTTANLFVAGALLIGAPFFVFFGALSDRIGRKPVILAGCLLAALSYFMVFPALLQAANPALVQAQQTTKVTVMAYPPTCSFQGSPIAREINFTTSCDQAKRLLAQNFIPYENVAVSMGTVANVSIGDKTFESVSATLNDQRNGFSADSVKSIAAFKKSVLAAAAAADLTVVADKSAMNKPLVLALLTFLVILAAMVYGPMAAMLVEMFPTRIRYTSMSVPYHIGNGWFGGLLPTTTFAMTAATGDIFYGLWYPVVVAAAVFLICLFFIRETKDMDI